MSKPMVQHGTRNTYNHGCRCDQCRRANADYQVAYQHRNRDAGGLAPGDPRHGTRNGYDNYRCRCTPCSQAKTTYSRTYYRRERAAAAAP